MTMSDSSSDEKKKKVLVISGGGVYGAIPCCFLNTTHPKDFQKISVVGGTSVGGMVALHLSLYGNPQMANDEFFQNVGSFFQRGIRNRIDPFSPKYESDGVERKLKEMLVGTVADCKMRFVVPCLNFKTVEPVVFHNFDESYSHMELWKIARATSAAPTYFPPFSENILVDGGILENLPIMTTASVICKYWNARPSDLDVFAIGTGRMMPDGRKTLDAVSRYSKLDWARTLMPILTTKGNEMMSRLWGENMGFNSFTLFNPVAVSGNGIDGISEIDTIREKCEIYLGDFTQKWKRFLED